MITRSKILSLITCLSITVLIYGGVQAASYVWTNMRTTKRFNYSRFLNNEALTWTGPKKGERINLKNFFSANRQQLPVSENRLIVLGFVSSKCWMCAESSDLLEYVKTNSLKNGVDYHLVSLGTNETPEEFFNYTDKLNLSIDSYVWNENKDSINSSLQNMVVPSHILVNSDGKVLRGFPGSGKEKEQRDQMGNQTMDEILGEKAKSTTSN